ncbi:hypothetical protein [Luteipulveratus halotolerans]|uniref:Peptidase inhibitor family I36 protein n=1 Tax=Luteipulveratus halotolerans TaxID=1631356 RepID=A0A0L6CMK3_9MICO|nr:hypothetical protein [Luteipulveratus halotolerans]KNX38949.1 hypothetical protein VV01_20355 [Luteipulveratus halotolerans]
MRLLKSAAAVALAAGATFAGAASLAPGADAAQPSTAQIAGSSWHGCPWGAVCIYPQDAGYNGDRPSNVYWSYGSHKLYNQYGTHMIVNNQYGGALATLCTGSYGTGCIDWLPAGTAVPAYLTPYNSMLLAPNPAD